MKVAVIGLGKEGKNALYALLKYGYQVYASDMNPNINCGHLINENDFQIDLGKHDWDKINSADALVISPSLWNMKTFKDVISNNNLLSLQ